MRYVLLLDTETTSLSPEDGRCIEVACILYDIQLATPIMSYASLMGPPGDNPAANVNRIKSEALNEAPAPEWVWGAVARIAEAAECFVAHRAEFDSQWVPASVVGTRRWVCTKTDFAWPGDRRGDHLTHLALDLGLGVAHAHRAMADVDTMSRILTRVAEMGGNLQEMFRLAMRPKKRYVAKGVPFEKNDILKQHGFLWSGAPKKEWYRSMPTDDIAKLPFLVVES